MIVYVESNFVLELAFLQEEHESCITLLNLAESHAIDLALPSFSIGEPYEVWVRRSKQRRELRNQLGASIRELSRSRPYQESSREFQDLLNVLLRSGEEEKQRLDDTLERLLQIADVIPTDLHILQVAITLQNSRSLSPQDSIVYASILAHLAEAPKGPHCFITKNAKDFVNPDIENDLAAYTCRLLTKFANGLGYIRSQLPTD